MNGTLADGRPGWPRTNVAALVGRGFGRLTVTAETAGRGSNGAIVWECRCRTGSDTHVLRVLPGRRQPAGQPQGRGAVALTPAGAARSPRGW